MCTISKTLLMTMHSEGHRRLVLLHQPAGPLKHWRSLIGDVASPQIPSRRSCLMQHGASSTRASGSLAPELTLSALKSLNTGQLGTWRR